MLLSSCSKDEDINVTNLVGTWNESYDNPHFIMDGTVEYTFYDNGTYQVYSYDALSHMEHTRTNTYVLQDDLLILNTEYSENALRYHIVKFKKTKWLGKWKALNIRKEHGGVSISISKGRKGNKWIWLLCSCKIQIKIVTLRERE